MYFIRNNIPATQQRKKEFENASSPLAKASAAAARLAPFVGEVSSLKTVMNAIKNEGGLFYEATETLGYKSAEAWQAEYTADGMGDILSNYLMGTAKWVSTFQSPMWGFFGQQTYASHDIAQFRTTYNEENPTFIPAEHQKHYTIPGFDHIGDDQIQTISFDMVDGSGQRGIISPMNSTVFYHVWGPGSKCSTPGIVMMDFPDGIEYFLGNYEGPNDPNQLTVAFPTKAEIVTGVGDQTEVEKPHVGSWGFQWRTNEFGPMNRSAAELGVFLNHIKGTDISRCIPYFDLKIITPERVPIEGFYPEDHITKYPSLSRFFVDDHQTGSSVSDKFRALAQYPTANTKADDDGVAINSIAGMESFTLPQSIVNATNTHIEGIDMSDASGRAVPIMDRMRAFATVDSFSVKIEPQLQFMVFMTAQMSITLHDRSRLADMAPLIKPEVRGGTELLIEWGWSCGNNQSMANPITAFLDGSRSRGVFNVSNSSYNFTDDGQVKIDLSLHSKGPTQMMSTSVSEGWKNDKGESLEDLFTGVKLIAQEIAVLKGQLGEGRSKVPDILGSEILNTVSSTSTAASMSREDRVKITKKVEEAYKKSGESRSELLAEIKKLITKQYQLDFTVSKAIQEKITKLSSKCKNWATTDPMNAHLRYKETHIMETNNAASKYRKKASYAKPTFASFAEVVYRFVAAPLENTLEFDEVQCHFYTFNNKASYMANQPISAFPIKVKPNSKIAPLDPVLEKIINKQIKQGGGLTIAEFLGCMNSDYFNNYSLSAFGFSDLFVLKEGKRVISEKKKSTYKVKIDEVLAKAYGGKESLKFINPQIACLSEVLPSYEQSGKSILKLHFYDSTAKNHDAIGTLMDTFRSDILGGAAKADELMAKKHKRSHGESLKDPHSVKLIEEGLEDGTIVEIGAQTEAGETVTYYKPINSPKNLYRKIKQLIPSLTVGKQTSMLKGISLQTMNDPRMAAIAMLESLKRQASQDKSEMNDGAKSQGMPERIQPVQCSFELIGCPFINPFNQIFIDFNTGTTAEDIYLIGSVEHKVSPGEFTTSVTAFPRGATSSYNSITSGIDAVLADAETAEENAETIQGMSMEELMQKIVLKQQTDAVTDTL